MPSTGTKKGAGVRIATPGTRKPRDKTSHEEAGDDNQAAEDNHAEDHDVFEDQEPTSEDVAFLQKKVAKIQKQLARMKPSDSSDRAATGPASKPTSR